ncbi:hypothetical protein [Streptomyces albidoflavus]|uniref:hypothetical protein n=1 Tax=Streptomyces albidoflavus TaxID=1886 RepID=UPI0033FAEA4E
MTESMATRQTTSMMDRARATLARDVQDAADELTRFAKDIELGVSTGAATRIMQAVQQIAIRAAKLEAMREVSGLYEAERGIAAERTTEK